MRWRRLSTGWAAIAVVGSMIVANPASAAAAGWAVAAPGNTHTCAIRGDGTLWCWGYNGGSRLGTGESGADARPPIRIGDGSDWTSVSATSFHTCGIRAGGTLWCWGDNDGHYFRLGDGTAIDRPVPTRIGTDGTWASVSTGPYHSCALRTDGTLWCWGDNQDGQLGTGSTLDQNAPVQVGTDGNWASVSAGDRLTCGIRDDGTLWCWGNNRDGQLGTGEITDDPVLAPVRVGDARDWTGVSAGWDTDICGTRADASLWCWGNNRHGQLADGTTRARTTPVQVAAGTAWASVAVGSGYLCGIHTDGTLWCWGRNSTGAVADGTTTDRWEPTQVGTDSDWARVATGAGHACAIRTGGALSCWGFNSYGNVGDGTANWAQTTPVTITATSTSMPPRR